MLRPRFQSRRLRRLLGKAGASTGAPKSAGGGFCNDSDVGPCLRCELSVAQPSAMACVGRRQPPRSPAYRQLGRQARRPPSLLSRFLRQGTTTMAIARDLTLASSRHHARRHYGAGLRHRGRRCLRCFLTREQLIQVRLLADDALSRRILTITVRSSRLQPWPRSRCRKKAARSKEPAAFLRAVRTISVSRPTPGSSGRSVGRLAWVAPAQTRRGTLGAIAWTMSRSALRHRNHVHREALTLKPASFRVRRRRWRQLKSD
jgi:hypothetical protein